MSGLFFNVSVFLDISSCTMAANKNKKIDVTAYVAIIMKGSEYGARPLLAGIFTPVGENNMDETTLRQAGPFNNLHVFTRKFPFKPMSHERASRFYNETVTSAVLRYQDKANKARHYQDKAMRACPTFPKLPLVLLTGPELLRQAVKQKLMSADTVNHCLTFTSSAGQEIALSSASSEALQDATTPALPGSGVGAALPSPGTGASSSSPSSSADAASSLQNQPNVGASDTIALALEQSGLGNLHCGVPAVGAEVSIIEEVEGDTQVGEEVQSLDDDRIAEDALRHVSTLPLQDQDNPVVKCLVASVKHLEKTNREKDRKILALNKLSMTMEMRLQGFQESSSGEIAKGLLPKIKGVVTEVQNGSLDEIKKDIGVLTNLVMESMGATPADDSAGVKSSLGRLAGSVADLKLASRSIMGAAMVIDQKLTASGLVINEDPNTQVNIPEVLVQIRSDQVIGSTLPTPSPPPSSVLSCQEGSTPGSTKVSMTSGLKRTALSTPLHPSSTFSSLTPSTTPKKVRWDVTADLSVASASKKPQPLTVKSVSAKPAPSRSLAPQLNSSLGDTPASNPALWKTMLKAQDTYPTFESPTLEQIEERIAKYQSVVPK